MHVCKSYLGEEMYTSEHKIDKMCLLYVYKSSAFDESNTRPFSDECKCM